MYHAFAGRGFQVDILVTGERGAWFDLVAKDAASVLCLGVKSSLGALAHSYRVGRRLRRGNYDAVLLNHTCYAQAALQMLPDHVAVIPILRNDHESIYQVGLGNASTWNVAVGISEKVCSVARRRVPGRPVVCIPNGIELPGRERLNGRRPFGGTVRLIWVGRLSPEKGVKYLPEILKGCLDREIDFHLTVVGDGQERDSLLGALRRLESTERVSFAGTIDPDGVYEKLLDSHILLMPSTREGLGNVVIEAQACGCVPVASRLDGVTDMMIDHENTGMLVRVGDVEGFVEAISRLSGHEAEWLHMSTQGPVAVRRTFTIERMISSYINLINDAREGAYPLPEPRRGRFAVDSSLFSRRQQIPALIEPFVPSIGFWRRPRNEVRQR